MIPVILLHALTDLRRLLGSGEEGSNASLLIALAVTSVALLAASSVFNCGAACSQSVARAQRAMRDSQAQARTEAMNAKSKLRWGGGNSDGSKGKGKAGADETRPKFQHPRAVAITGSEGMVGRSTVAALAAGGRCKHVICMDIMAEPDDFAERRERALQEHGCTLQYVRADITDEAMLTQSDSQLQRALRAARVECMVHVAALVGPFFPTPSYRRVNYLGTLNVLEACRVAGIRAVVDCSSPSTRFSGDDIAGLDEDEVWQSLGGRYQGLHEYATTKAMGEGAVLAAAVKERGKDQEEEEEEDPRWLCTCAVAPHQVYGPSDRLFLPALMRTARKGMLRVMGQGNNCVSFTNEANISHGLLLAAGALCAHAEWRRKRASANEVCTPEEIALGRAGARVNGEFMVVTDATPEMPMGIAINFWDAIDDATSRSGIGAIRSGFRGSCRCPYRGLLLPIAYIGKLYTMLTGKFVNITPFTVRMLVIDRYFDIGKARTLLGYEPLVNFYDEERGWNAAVDAAYKRCKEEDGW